VARFYDSRCTYRTLSTAQPAYLHNLISVQPPGRIRSSTLITIARPPSSSSLKITDRFFCYAWPSLLNKLPALFRLRRSSSVTTITPSITSSLFYSRLKTHLFHKSFPPDCPLDFNRNAFMDSVYCSAFCFSFSVIFFYTVSGKSGPLQLLSITTLNRNRL